MNSDRNSDIGMLTDKTMSTPLGVRFSKGQSRYDNSPIQIRLPSFSYFQDYVFKNRSAYKGRNFFCGPLALGPHDDPAKYPGNDYFRLATRALPRIFLATDQDWYATAEVQIRLFELFKQFQGFAYTTRKHRANAPRTRAVFELSRLVSREEGVKLGEAFDAFVISMLGANQVKLDKTVYRSEQPVFMPTVDSEWFVFDGIPLDVDAFIQTHATRQSIPPSESSSSNLASSAQRSGISQSSKISVSTNYARLKLKSVERVLGSIACDEEPIWFEVACALARAYGEQGRDFFVRFSRGEFSGTPYPAFDLLEVNAKFDRALNELATRPSGFGVRHLIKMAGLKHNDVEFEDSTRAISQHSTAVLVLPLTRNNRPLQVAENLQAVLDHHAVVARYNQVTKDCEILIPNFACVADESSNASISKLTDLSIKAGMTAARIPELAASIAVQNVYCPVQSFITSKPWDGLCRFNQLVGQMSVSSSQFAHLLIRKWLIQAVAAVFEPRGVASAGMLVLTGSQSLGKTRFFKDLASGVPTTFLEGATLDPANRDSVMAVVRHWLVELGELDATFRRSDLAQLKAFITRQEDVLRRPYAQRESTYPRRTVFAGTVNDYGFLHDLTGNRRFWPVSVHAMTRDASIDYQQLWAEVKTWYDAGETWYLSAAELNALNLYSERFLVLEPVVEQLLQRYDFSNCTSWNPVPMTDICVKLGVLNPTKAQTMQLAAAIKKYNGNQAPRTIKGQRRHLVPA